MKKLLTAVLAVCLLAVPVMACAQVTVSVLATGDVHIRKAPNLEGEEMDVLKKGNELPFGFDTSVDERGVMWYLVGESDDEFGWISGKYSVLTDGSVDGIAYDYSLRGIEYTVLSDDTLAESPYKGTGSTNVGKDTTVTGTGFSVLVDGEHNWLLVEDGSEDGWIDTLNVSEK